MPQVRNIHATVVHGRDQRAHVARAARDVGQLQQPRFIAPRITRVAYQEGEIGILELLDSLRVNRAASLRLLDLEAQVKEAWIELERVVGEEVRP